MVDTQPGGSATLGSPSLPWAQWGARCLPGRNLAKDVNRGLRGDKV